ncbi:MBL fold metallo-hydrolase [Zhouia sp. PK063]|uniref:MBL fold metallo-hydrolase n=1 Tax=Zhouia sp. PK063 TaxID=3373602 RepID=UPI0037B06E35
MKTNLLMLFIFYIGICKAQDVTDHVGAINITPIEHASLVISSKNHTIFVDPVNHTDQFNKFGTPDLVFITDIHGDHMSAKTLERLKLSTAKLIVPQAVADKLPTSLKNQLIILNNGDVKKINDVKVAAIPMYNLPESTDAFHTKGRGNGYVITIKNKRIYISGDTEDIPEMRALKNIDIAFVCMNLPYTMTVEQAASGVLAFAPKIVYPYHYRGTDGMSDVAKFKSLVQKKNAKIDVRLKNWYPKKP